MQRPIMSSLYQVDPSVLETLPEVAYPAVHELEQQAAELVAMHRVRGGRTYDLCRLRRALLNVLFDGRLTPVSAALVLHRVFAPIPIGDRATLALFITNAIRSDRLVNLASGALLTLQRALTYEDPEVSCDALSRLDIELKQRPHFSAGLSLVVTNQVSPQVLRAAHAYVKRTQSDETKHLVILVPPEEERTPLEVMLEHLRLQLRCAESVEIGNFITRGAVRLLPTRGLKAKASFSTMLSHALSHFLLLIWPPLRLDVVVVEKQA